MRILFVDDHQLVREALVYYLKASGEELDVVEASSLAEVLDAPQGREFDVVLLDYKLPGLSGDEAVAAMSRRFPDTPVIVLSGAMTRLEARSALNHGAAGVISKDVEGRRLIGMITGIVAGEIEVIGLPEQVDPGPRADAALDGLSNRERQVARLLVRGWSNKEIANALAIADITVRLHLRSLFRKLGARSRTDAVRIVLTRSPTLGEDC